MRLEGFKIRLDDVIGLALFIAMVPLFNNSISGAVIFLGALAIVAAIPEDDEARRYLEATMAVIAIGVVLILEGMVFPPAWAIVTDRLASVVLRVLFYVSVSFGILFNGIESSGVLLRWTIDLLKYLAEKVLPQLLGYLRAAAESSEKRKKSAIKSKAKQYGE
ncbi:MAG TPA: hypothetical protein PLV59_03430 [Candidatus Dojkabacteria bacterium]|nr:hypothetical protein [Candidatus Dojkabacteria bacterium]